MIIHKFGLNVEFELLYLSNGIKIRDFTPTCFLERKVTVLWILTGKIQIENATNTFKN